MSWAAVIGAVGAVAGGVLGSQGAKKAGSAQEAAAQAAIAEQQRQFDLTRSDTAPYRNIGGQALNALGSIYGYSPQSQQPLSFSEWASQHASGPIGSSVGNALTTQPAPKKKHHGGLFGFLTNPLSALDPAGSTIRAITGTPNTIAGMVDPSGRLIKSQPGSQPAAGGDLQAQYQQYLAGFKPPENTATAPDYSAFYQSPDYQFRKQQGMSDIGSSFAARGGAASGNALKALADFNSNLAAGEFGNYFNRQAALAGIGQTATQQSQQAGQYAAGNVGNALIGAGNARASGLMGQYDAYGNALNGLGGVLGDWLQSRKKPNYTSPPGWA